MIRTLRHRKGLLPALPLILLSSFVTPAALAQTPAPPAPADARQTPQPDSAAARMIEERSAQRLLAAADTRAQLEQFREATELYRQVVERYPRSQVRFVAFLRLAEHQLLRNNDPAAAIPFFERAAVEENEDPVTRADALLGVGRCYYEQQRYPQAFAALRTVIDRFPATPQADQAYFYIGNAHYKLGAYNRAVQAFGKVGTAAQSTADKPTFELGKRLFIRVSDIDLVSIPDDQQVVAEAITSGGDRETIILTRVGGVGSHDYLGEIDTALASPRQGDGLLQLGGEQTVTVRFIDAQTADKQTNVLRSVTLTGVYDASVDFVDGTLEQAISSLTIGKPALIRVIDFDQDQSPAAESIQVNVIHKRPKGPPTAEELDAEALARAQAAAEGRTLPESTAPRFDQLAAITIELTETVISREELTMQPEQIIRSALFVGEITLLPADAAPLANALRVEPGDVLEVVYNDQLNTSGKPVLRTAQAQAIVGSLGEVKAARQEIRDLQLEIQTRLKKAEALTNIGKRFKQLGLRARARQQFEAGVNECNELAPRARQLGGETLELLYLRLWELYIELEELDKAAAICLALQKEFPNSQFLDRSLLGLGQTQMRKGEFSKAIAVFRRVLDLPNTTLKADALFAIGNCHEEMAKPREAGAQPNAAALEQAFIAYQTVFQNYPASGVASEAIGKIADYHMTKRNFDQAIAIFQQALDGYPDADFRDRILFDYGRTLFRMERRDEALSRFRQLLSEYPQSKLAGRTRLIVQELQRTGPAAAN